MHPWLSGAAALLLLLLAPAYLRECLRGTVRPHPLSWGIWSALSLLGLSATAAGRADGVLPVLAIACVLQVATFIVALRQPSPPPHDSWQLVVLLPASIGAVVWLTASLPVAGSMGVVVADGCALVPTLAKTWTDPYSEPVLLWLGGAAAFGLGCASLGRLDIVSLLYPGYLVLSDLAIGAVALIRRQRLRTGRRPEHHKIPTLRVGPSS